MSQDNWNNNELQFARLLSEIQAMGITTEEIDTLGESMDLEPSEVHELFIRAEKIFEAAKPPRPN